MAVKTATHNSTIAGKLATVLHQPQPFPPYHVVIVLPPKPRYRLLCYDTRRYGRGVFGGVVVGDCGAGPIIPPGIISLGFIWAPGAIIAPGFSCSPGFMSAQQAIGAGPLWSCPGAFKLQLRKNPEKKMAATMNKLPATTPAHATAWFSRLGRGREFPGCSVAMPASSAGGGTSFGLVMG
jgi:hypothetical protein